jgi:hypothetical protein
MAVFTEKPPVTSSNCYETMKNASILIKLGTNVDWTTAFGNPLMYLLDGGRRRKSAQFFKQHFSNENMCFGPK